MTLSSNRGFCWNRRNSSATYFAIPPPPPYCLKLSLLKQPGSVLKSGISDSRTSRFSRYSGADAAQLVYRYNFDEHLIEPMVAAVAADYEAAKNGDKAAQQRIDNRTSISFLLIDMMPVVGTISSFAEAETKLDYTLAAVTILPGAGSAIKNASKIARQLRNEGKISEAIQTLNSVSDEIALLRRPVWRQSEIDVGKNIGSEWRDQISYKYGSIVHHGTPGSVRPDFVLGKLSSIEVKNYNISTNLNGLINKVSEQAIARQVHLPQGMVQEVVIDVRGQVLTNEIRRKILHDINSKSNGIIKASNIRFME